MKSLLLGLQKTTKLLDTLHLIIDNKTVDFLGDVAQRSEQSAHNRLVAGSNPAIPTKLDCS